MSAVLNKVLGFEGWRDLENRALVRWGIALALAAIAIRAFFWMYTGRVWEDALITVQHSENCASGLGLTHHPSEPRVHGFTSPLSVLVPLAADLVHVGLGITLIQLVSVLCGGLTVLFAMAFAAHPRVRLPVPAAVLMMAYLAFEHHQIFFGASGMETQIAVLVLLASFYYLIADQPLRLGVSLGLCMLARPDFLFWTLIAGGYVLCRTPQRFPRVVIAAACAYGPWLAFTTIYYGSPIPNTILAKALGYELWWRHPGLTYVDFKRGLVDTFIYNVFAQLGPTHLGHALHRGTFFWDKRVIANMVLALAGIGTVYSIVKRRWEWVPVSGFVFVYALYYALLVPNLFPWYFPPLTAATMLLSAQGLAVATTWLQRPQLRVAVQSTWALVYFAFIVAALPTTFRAEKGIQTTIENGVRRVIGQYLAEAMKPDETLGCEPLGYVGYYSRRTVYDYPGMGSRKVTDFLRTHPGERSMNGLFKHLLPDYLLLRPCEHAAIQAAPDGAWVDRDYRLVKTFEVPADAPLWLQDDYAARFLLFKKKTSDNGT